MFAVLFASAFADISLISDIGDIHDLLYDIGEGAAVLGQMTLHLIVGVFALKVGIAKVPNRALGLVFVLGADTG